MIAVRINIAQKKRSEGGCEFKTDRFLREEGVQDKGADDDDDDDRGARKADLDEQKKYIQGTWPKYEREVSRREGKQCQIVQFEPTQCDNKQPSKFKLDSIRSRCLGFGAIHTSGPLKLVVSSTTASEMELVIGELSVYEPTVRTVFMR